jgi:hypothetical protein
MSIDHVSHSRRSLAFAIALALTATSAAAITITVDDSGDAVSPTGCTLRGAVAAINNAAFGVSDPCTTAGSFGSSDAIDFAPALVGSTITLLQGELAVTNSVSIVGSGQTLNGNGTSRILNVSPSVSASNITLTNGFGKGAAAYVNVGGSLTLSNVHVTGNSGNYGALVAKAGSVLSLTDSFVTSNSSIFKAAGISIGGAGSTLTLTDSTISGNIANCGTNYCTGAIYSGTGGIVNVNGSTISGNAAYGGAAIAYTAGVLYAYASAVSMGNTTIAGNSATGTEFVAGALQENHNPGTHPSAGLTLTNVTLTGNSASTSNAAAAYVSGGVLLAIYFGGKLTAANTIDSGNTGTGGAAPTADFGANASKNPVVSLTFSLLGTALNVNPYNAASNANQFSDTPGLGTLQNNGGKTQTMALLPSSLAIDDGSNALAVDGSSNPLATDQTGFVRIYNGTVDMGAFEYPGDLIFRDGFE